MAAVDGGKSQVFFTDPERRDSIQKILGHFRASSVGEGAKPLTPLQNFIWRSLSFFDTYCVQIDSSFSYSIDRFGSDFDRALDTSDVDEGRDIEALAALCYLFVCEAKLVLPNGVPEDVMAFMEEVRVYNFSIPKNMILVHFAQHEMIVQIIRGYIHKPEMKAIVDLPSLLRRGEEVSSQLKLDIDRKKVEVEGLRNNLMEYEQAFNFVGLNRAFRSMRKMKAAESTKTFRLLCLIAVLMLIPLSFKVFVLALGERQLDSAAFEKTVFSPVAATSDQPSEQEPSISPDKQASNHEGEASSKEVAPEERSVQYFKEIMNVLVIVGLELLLLYLFKVSLQSYRSLKSQLLQLDLRIALCQFILKYSDLSHKLRSQSGSAETLMRFEQVIFSGIVSGEADIPSTFDGLDQFLKLLGKVKPQI